MKKALIIAGGTGGHIFPALSVAEAMTKQGWQIQWLGSCHGLESQLIRDKFPLTLIDVKGVRRNGVLTKMLLPWRLTAAVTKAYLLIKRFQPSVVLAMGGYAAAPGGLAAWLARIPLVIHEQNSIAGLTNRFLAKLASSVLQGFPRAFSNQRLNVTTVGNPVRLELTKLPSPKQRLSVRPANSLRILVLGGSQGAHALNERVMEAMQTLREQPHVSIWHQTGSQDYSIVEACYASLHLNYQVEAFINNIAAAYAWADLVICRSGALTISELASVGLASICIPYPYAVDQHQLHNARLLETAGAAVVIEQNQLNAHKLVELFSQFMQDRERLIKMAECAQRCAKPQAVEQVLTECSKVSLEQRTQRLNHDTNG